jgi:hypothetical protein
LWKRRPHRSRASIFLIEKDKSSEDDLDIDVESAVDDMEDILRHDLINNSSSSSINFRYSSNPDFIDEHITDISSSFSSSSSYPLTNFPPYSPTGRKYNKGAANKNNNIVSNQSQDDFDEDTDQTPLLQDNKSRRRF